jgi:hypothetical protein
MIRLGAVILGLTLVLLGSGLAEAVKNATGALPLGDGEKFVCIAANVGTGNISTIAVVIHFLKFDGSSTGSSTTDCGPVAPAAGCTFSAFGSTATDINAAYCEVTFPSGKVRTTACNINTSTCSDAR